MDSDKKKTIIIKNSKGVESGWLFYVSKEITQEVYLSISKNEVKASINWN
jgi:hypothetical protein